MKTKDWIILGLVIVVALLFIFKKQKVIVIDDSDRIAHLELRHIWDSIALVDYININKPLIDSALYYEWLVKEKDKRISILEHNLNKEQRKVDTSSVELLSTYFDSFVGEREKRAVKILDSTQLINSVKLFNENLYSRDILNELTDENNYQTIVSAKYEEAYNNCNEEVIALNDTLSNRNIENEQYVIDSTKECNDKIKKKGRRSFWNGLGVGGGLTLLLLALFVAGT